ncbi:MAG: DUF86 domain-containing protein [Phycisphaerae bacterium]|nr:DUF86 domain-containing protein [Phycisphaerae bacterium]
MRENGIVQRKLALLDEYLVSLSNELTDVNMETFADSWAMQRMTERALQTMIEIVIDVAERIIAVKGAGPIASSAEAMERLVTLGILKSATPYTEMVRFRNLIVHQYEQIDPRLLYQLATEKLDAFRCFRDEIDRA